jgi:hypothetical protein
MSTEQNEQKEELKKSLFHFIHSKKRAFSVFGNKGDYRERGK